MKLISFTDITNAISKRLFFRDVVSSAGRRFNRSIINNSGAALITVVAVFAVVSVLAASITALVFTSTELQNERGLKTQAYLTAKSVLNVTARHVESIARNRVEVAKLVDKTASGELPDMGGYTAEIKWEGQDAVKITVTGVFKGQSSTLIAIVGGIGAGS